MDLFNNEEIRALSWKEPFALLMLHGKIETRTWATSYRGLVLICASKSEYTLKTIDLMCGEQLAGKIVGKIGQFWARRLTSHGKAIAIGRLIDCRKMRPEDEDKCFVKYRPNLYCHIYEYVRPIDPFHWKGSQGWKRLKEDEKSKIILK